MNKNNFKIESVRGFFRNNPWNTRNQKKYEDSTIVLPGRIWKKILIPCNGGGFSVPDENMTFIEIPYLNENVKYRLTTWVVNNRLMPVLLPVSRPRPILPKRRKRQGLRVLVREARIGGRKRGD